MFSSIRNQLILLVVAAFISVLGVAAVSYWSQTQLTIALDEAVDDGVAMRNHMQSGMLHDNLRGLVEQYVGAVRENNDGLQKQAQQDVAKSSQGIVEEFIKNKDVASLPVEVKSEIARVEPLLRRYASSAQAVVKTQAADAGGLNNAREDFGKQFSILEKELGDIRDKIETALRDSRTRGTNLTERVALITPLVAVLALALILSLAFTITRNIARDVNRISSTIQSVNAGQLDTRTQMTVSNELGDLGRSFDALLDERVTTLNNAVKENETLNNSVVALLQTVFQLGNRDLTARAPVTEDIIGTVASSINQFSDETSRTLGDVQKIAEQVALTSESVRVQSVMVEETARAERDALQVMSNNLTQATDQLTQVASLTEQSNEVAVLATDATQLAMNSVQGTVQGMDQLRESISDMEKRFKRLGERSQEISTAVQLINAISERTHVLALNASMQAATAGEAGRGFAVVAEEVQRLSDSSRQATSTISQLVGNIQAETNETLFTVNRLISDVVRQSELAQRAGVQMNQTQETTSQLVSLVRQIAQFSEQQAKLATSLQQSVLDINAGTEQTSAAIAEQTASTQSLADSSRQLTAAVGQFKLV